MSKWDDEFDLEDEPQPKKNKQDKKNRNSTSNNDFYDLEEDSKKVKLPIIAKNPPPSNVKNSRSAANISLAEIPKRKPEPTPPPKQEKYEEEEYEFEESLAPNPSAIKQKSPKVEQKKAVSPKKAEPQEEDPYANEEFEEDKYEEDFETHEEHKPSPAVSKPRQQPKAPAKAPNLPKPVPKDRKGAESVAKKIESRKGDSRNAVRSQSASRSGQNSRTKAEQKKDEAPNKYSTLAEKTCPTYERATLQECNMDRLTRENDKIRGLIKKFNDELNDLINRNIMQLKSKKEEKVVAPEEVLKVLEEQRSSNETALQVTIRELQKLKGKEGELREEEHHLTLDQRIAETKTALVEIGKAITKLKLEVNSEGNKLSKIDKDKDSGQTQQAGNIKNSLIAMKKEEEKNDQVLEKLYIKFEELTRKISQAESKYNLQIEEAKAKGLSVQVNPELIKKAEEIKKKIEISRLHKMKTESLFKTKCEMINHECEQVRMQAKAIDNSIQACANNCEDMQNESRKIVEKARKSSKLSEELLSTLENMISELENGTPISNRDKEDGSSFSHPRGAKKYQSQKNVEKISSQPAPKEQAQDDSNLKKPTLFKKKEKEEEKQDERVWKDDKNNEPKKQEKTVPIPDLAKFQNKEQVEKKDDEKKKPFVIKRNKQTKPQTQPALQTLKEEPKIEKQEPKKQAEKNEEAPNLAPRMMKFRRNKPEEGSKTEEPNKETIEKPVSIPTVVKEEPKPEEKPAQQEESEKPIFAPKRFNLKLKDRANEQAGYVATAAEKKEQPKPVQQIKPKPVEEFKPKPVEQFKPKGLTVDKQPFALAAEPKNEPLKTIEPKIAANEEQEKPKFNLRLRDRQRESNKIEIKAEVPPEPVKEPELKIPITLDDKAKENNQYTNPYANAEAPKREREGPLKKQKPAQSVQKQNFNIYEQAEDITNVKEVKIGDSPKPTPPPAVKAISEEPNLHDLLGIKKNKQNVDDDLLVDAATLGGAKAKGKRESKKDTNFFGDLQM